jgi:ACS family tartrate transporter-like MFS transporter
MTVSEPMDEQIGRTTVRKMSRRLLPLLFLGYGIAYVDRVNISFAAIQMNRDLHFSATVYGLGGGLFFLSYALLEIPSNLMLLRYGARRWIARIMVTWGVLAVGMMFVKTPGQFYTMRFALGAAEAGFFPGVLCYLMQWFPREYLGRAISRFYIAYPLSSVLMGAIAGPLLGLGGHLGLAGWQWLFLIEGIPAIVLSGVIVLRLTDAPEQAAWLTEEERSWIHLRLSVSGSTGNHVALLRALSDPAVLKLCLCNVFVFGANYAFSLSAPIVLRDATHWNVSQVGLTISAVAVLGAIAMVVNGAHSDRSRERYFHAAVPLALAACAFATMGLSTVSWVTVLAYGLYFIWYAGAQAAFWLIPGETLRGRSAAVGLAAIGSVGMMGAFIGPYTWGLARDFTGSYRAGLLSLAISFAIAALLLVLSRQKGNRAEAAVITIS